MTLASFVRQLELEIDYCVAEAESQGWRGHPSDYQLTEYDCLTISASLEVAGLAIEIANRRSAASIHDACVLHDEHVRTPPRDVSGSDREALDRVGNPAVVHEAADLDAAVGMILEALTDKKAAARVATAVEQLSTQAPHTAEALRRLLSALQRPVTEEWSEDPPRRARKAGGGL